MLKLIRPFGMEIRSLEEDGTFDGYASVFGNTDSYGDVIEKGAFKKTIKENPTPPILWQHDTTQPIGVTQSMKEDDYGLYVVGKLVLDVQKAVEAYALMKAKAMKGLSIGFSLLKWMVDKDQQTRRLKEVKLWEWSPVTFPANTLANVANVRSLMASLEGTRCEELRAIAEAYKGLTTMDGVKPEDIVTLSAGMLDLLVSDRPGGAKTATSLVDMILDLAQEASTLPANGMKQATVDQAIDLLSGLEGTVDNDLLATTLDNLRSLAGMGEPIADPGKGEPTTPPAVEPRSVQSLADAIRSDLRLFS